MYHPGREGSRRWDGFSIGLGVPVLLIFSVGSVVVLTGTLSPLIWVISVVIGFIQAFVWAEMAGLFPHKSGGHSLYGSEALRRYNRFLPPLDIWGNWFAWSPVLAIGGLVIGGYVQTQWLPGQDWSYGWGPFKLSMATVIGAAALLIIFWVNHFSIKSSARTQTVLGVVSLVPLALLIVVPLFQGRVDIDNLTPFAPPDSPWLSWQTVTTIAAGLFVAAWSAYAFETVICYTAEYKNPAKAAPKAIIAAGVLNLVFYVLGPVVLLGVVGREEIAKDPAVAFAPLARDAFGAGSDVLIALLIVAFVLIINTAILGSARTLYQASAEGYTFRGFQVLSKRKVPVRAMGFDVGVNLFLMLLGTPIYILAASTVGYMVTNVFDGIAGWLLRRDTAAIKAPYRAPRIAMSLILFLAGLNFLFQFLGGPSWGWTAMGLGWGIVLVSIPIYLYRRHTDEYGGLRGLLQARRLMASDAARAAAGGDEA